MLPRFTTLGLTIAGVLAATACAFAQEKKQPSARDAQKAYEALSKPGKPHSEFRRLVGRWNCEMKLYADPKTPKTSKASASFRLLMGGRYLQQQFAGTMAGQPFHGMGITGYDNAQKKYVGTWIDDTGTGIMATQGTYDPKTQTLTETGTTSSPLGPMKLKMVSKYFSNDKFLFTMSMAIPGGEQKMMEITYTRAKGKPKKRK
jgi:Protein of unknown function (DUF1579)